MAEVSTSVAIPAPADAAEAQLRGRFARWLASERVFRLIPFVIVEGLFVLIVLVPFALTIWISLLKWRANRPFETARFTGLENYQTVLTQRPVLAGARAHVLFRGRRRRARADHRLRAGNAGVAGARARENSIPPYS